MSEPEPRRILIVGAGLAGSLLACMLGRRGERVIICERRPDPRIAGFAGGRSINLAVSARGLHALRRVELDRQVLAEGVPMPGRMLHQSSGQVEFQPYSKDSDEAIHSVSRGKLNVCLLDAAEACDTVTMRFGLRCVDVDLESTAVSFEDIETGETLRLEADLIVGADGAYSEVRGRLQRTEGFDYSQRYLSHGYKELEIPPSSAGAFAMEPNALHIWPRGGYMMIALPNADRSFTCTLFWPRRGRGCFDALQTDEQILDYFNTNFRDAAPLMPTLVEDYRRNPIGSLVTIRCDPWHYGDSVVLIGDAAHAIVPFYGQGINAGFEDCEALIDCLEQHGDNLGAALSAYSAGRRVHGDAIADMALDNFIEMRDKVGSKAFLLRKAGQRILHRLFPKTFVPLYNLVSFSTMPYDDARRMVARRTLLLRAGMAAVVLILVIVFAAVLT